MPRKRASNPRLIALLDKREKLRQGFERSYARMRRAFARMEKTRQALIRLSKRLDALDAQASGTA